MSGPPGNGGNGGSPGGSIGGGGRSGGRIPPTPIMAAIAAAISWLGPCRGGGNGSGGGGGREVGGAARIQKGKENKTLDEVSKWTPLTRQQRWFGGHAHDLIVVPEISVPYKNGVTSP